MVGRVPITYMICCSVTRRAWRLTCNTEKSVSANHHIHKRTEKHVNASQPRTQARCEGTHGRHRQFATCANLTGQDEQRRTGLQIRLTSGMMSELFEFFRHGVAWMLRFVEGGYARRVGSGRRAVCAGSRVKGRGSPRSHFWVNRSSCGSTRPDSPSSSCSRVYTGEVAKH